MDPVGAPGNGSRPGRPSGQKDPRILAQTAEPLPRQRRGASRVRPAHLHLSEEGSPGPVLLFPSVVPGVFLRLLPPQYPAGRARTARVSAAGEVPHLGVLAMALQG